MSNPTSPPLPPPFNYAESFGIKSTPAAAVFAIVYAPLFMVFLFKSFKTPSYVYFIITIFCNVRLLAFVLRAILAGNASAGQSLGFLIVDEVLLGAGFAGLLYSTYILILDRDILYSKTNKDDSLLLVLLRNRLLFHIPLAGGVGLGIVASTRVNNASHGMDGTTKTLHEIGAIILLVLTVLTASLALRHLGVEPGRRSLAYGPTYKLTPQSSTNLTAASTTTYAPNRVTTESDNVPRENDIDQPFGQSHGAHVICGIVFFLLVRVVFLTITMNNLPRQNEERLWYPFFAVPEVLAVVLFMVPKMVPTRAELRNL